MKKLIRKPHLITIFFGKKHQKTGSSVSILSDKYFHYLKLTQKAPNTNHFKNTEVTKQQLNKVYAVELDKDEYRYDSKGNLLEDIYYEWNADHWENSMKYEFTHDGNGNKTLNVSYLWNGTAATGWKQKNTRSFIIRREIFRNPTFHCRMLTSGSSWKP